MKTLISTLGRGQYDREKKEYDYKEALYVLPDGREVRTKLVSKALIEYLQPDEIYVIGTDKSLWKLADEILGSYKRVEVPFGKTTDEFWEMFKIIVQEIDVKGKELYIDITHSFRAIPLLVSTVMNLFEKVKGAKVKGVYYGIFEAKDEKGKTPVVDLLPIIELNRWIEGFTLFNNYGNGDYLAGLIEERLSSLDIEDRKRLGWLNPVPKLLRKYSQAVGFTALDFIQSSVKQVDEKLSGLGDLPIGLEALELLKDSFSETSRRLNADTGAEPLWKKHMRVVRWLFEKRRYSQAVIALEECIFTYVMETVRLDPLDDRRKKLGGIFREDCDKHRIFSEDMNATFSRIQELRNSSGHAFMKRNVSESTIRDAVSELESYIEEIERILLDDPVKNPNELRERILSLSPR